MPKYITQIVVGCESFSHVIENSVLELSTPLKPILSLCYLLQLFQLACSCFLLMWLFLFVVALIEYRVSELHKPILARKNLFQSCAFYKSSGYLNVYKRSEQSYTERQTEDFTARVNYTRRNFFECTFNDKHHAIIFLYLLVI